MSDLTKYGDVYSASNGMENGCLSKTKASILKSASSMSIDEVLPGTNSMLDNIRTYFSTLEDYCFVEISTLGELEDNIKVCSKLVAIIMETRTDKKHLEQSLTDTDDKVESFLQQAEENNLHYVSLLLGNQPSSQIYSRSRREISSSSEGTNSSDTNSSTVTYIIRAYPGVILFRAQNFSISMNTSGGNQTSSYRLTQNNTQVSNFSTSNRTSTYFEIKTIVDNQDVLIKFSFPIGGASSNTTSNGSDPTIPADYWSIHLDVSVGSASPVRLIPPRLRISVPQNYSFHCTPITNFSVRLADGSQDFKKVVVTIAGMQVQPYGTSNSTTNSTVFKFSAADDCVGFFTIDIWMGIFAAFVIFSLLYCAVMAMMAISTSDRLDDPQGKPLMVEGTVQ